MFSFSLMDVAPDPVSTGIVAVVILLVVGFVGLLAAALVVLLWLRKRRMRYQETIEANDVGNL